MDRDRCTVRFSRGKLDLSALDLTPREGHADALVDGELAVVLSNAQILCGKLQRANRSPVRDVFYLAVAGELNPQALAIAGNTRTARELEAITAAWRASNRVFTYNAPLDLNGVPPQLAGDMTNLGHAGAAALTGARYERVRIRTEGNVGRVETRTRNGAEWTVTIEPARIDETFEAYLWLNHYLPQTDVRPRSTTETACARHGGKGRSSCTTLRPRSARGHHDSGRAPSGKAEDEEDVAARRLADLRRDAPVVHAAAGRDGDVLHVVVHVAHGEAAGA